MSRSPSELASPRAGRIKRGLTSLGCQSSLSLSLCPYECCLFCFAVGIGWESEVHFLHSCAVDGFEVVLHGDDVVASFTPFGFTLCSFFEVGMVTCVIVSHEHEGGSAMLFVAQAVVVHGAVATAVAK